MSAAVAKIPTIQSDAFAVGESFLKGGISREGVGRSVEHWFSVVVMSWV
jgi:hypothetical protein